MPLLVVLLGLVVGSFLNVVIVRLPKGQSVVVPRSHCPHCRTTLGPWELIPVLSWLLQRGRCRTCGAKISWQYPLVEAVNAGLWLAVWLRYGWGIEGFVYSVFVSFLVALSAIDLQTQLLPNRLTFPGMVLGLAGRWLITGHPWDGLLGWAMGLGIITIIIFISRGGMGFGDAKLMGMLGAFLGWRRGLAALMVGAVLGGIIGILLLLTGRKGRKDMIPYGPFLAAGAVIVVLMQECVARYIAWL